MAKTTRKGDDGEKDQVVADEAAAEERHQRTLGDNPLLEGDTRGTVVPPEFAPVEEPEPLTPLQAWLADARDAQAVWGRGEVVSPDRVKALVSAALGFLETRDGAAE